MLVHSKLGHFTDPLEIKANRLRIKRFLKRSSSINWQTMSKWCIRKSGYFFQYFQTQIKDYQKDLKNRRVQILSMFKRISRYTRSHHYRGYCYRLSSRGEAWFLLNILYVATVWEVKWKIRPFFSSHARVISLIAYIWTTTGNIDSLRWTIISRYHFMKLLNYYVYGAQYIFAREILS